jgi:hypothetical protein
MGWRRVQVVAACSLAALASLWTASASLAAAPSIALRSPCAYQVFQRDSSDRGSIVVWGRTHRLRGAVEIRWGANPWMRVACRSDGVFHARLPAPSPGQSTFVVRSARLHRVRATRAAVGVGDIYAIAGQSNASGRSPLRFSATSSSGLVASLFGNDDHWRRLRDPVDSAAGQVDRVSADRYAGGSVWPLVAAELMDAERVPVALVPCAKGTTPIRRWLPRLGALWSADTLFGSMLRRCKAVGKVRAVLFWQGEYDARHLTPGDAYESSLRSLGSAVALYCHAPLVAAQIGDFDERYTAAGIDAIRLAQQRAWEHSAVIAGPPLYDIDLEHEVHFLAAADVKVAARRWSAAVLDGVLGRESAGRPHLTRALWDGGRTVTLLVDPGVLPLLPGPVSGILVRENGVPLHVAGAAVTGADTVTLTLTSLPAGPLTVTLGSGHTAAGAHVPVESSIAGLPLAMFIDEPVTAVAPWAGMRPR